MLPWRWNAAPLSVILLVFSCRSFSDSCFLSSPLCSELADVQWYGQDKAKPGTLVWHFPTAPKKTTTPHCPFLLPHHCPSLLPSKTNLILEALRENTPTSAFCPPVRALRTEKEPLQPFPYRTTPPFLKHTDHEASGGEEGTTEHSGISEQFLTLNQHQPHLIGYISHLVALRLQQCTPTPSEDTCWIWATSFNQFIDPQWPLLHFYVTIPIVCLLSWVIHLFLSKRWWQANCPSAYCRCWISRPCLCLWALTSACAEFADSKEHNQDAVFNTD